MVFFLYNKIQIALSIYIHHYELRADKRDNQKSGKRGEKISLWNGRKNTNEKLNSKFHFKYKKKREKKRKQPILASRTLEFVCEIIDHSYTKYLFPLWSYKLFFFLA